MKKIISVLLVMLCMTVCLCACDNTEPQTDPQTDSTTTTTVQTTTTTEAPAAAGFEVKVVDQNGAPVEGVMVQICKDSCIPAKTDANGVALFNMEITDGYKLSVMTCPTGYNYTGEAEIYLEGGSTSYTLEVQGDA